MGLDLYVGTVTRYMTGDWETLVEQWARESGQELRVVRAQPEPTETVTDPAVVLEAVETWRRIVGEQLGLTLAWDETLDACRTRHERDARTAG